MAKLKWTQSKFVPNCPIYNVYGDRDNSILRVEYRLDSKDWIVSYLGKTEKLVELPIWASETVKELAEDRFAEAINELAVELDLK